jgi:hypothetical protein
MLKIERQYTQHLGRKHYTGNYVASFAGYSVVAPTKDEAVQELETIIRTEKEFSGVRRYVFCSDGTVFCLYYNNGWCYDIMSANRPYPSKCMMAAKTEDSAYRQMLEHAAQYGTIVGPNKALQTLEEMLIPS